VQDSVCVPPPSTAARTISDLIHVSTGVIGRDLATKLSKLSNPSDCCLAGTGLLSFMTYEPREVTCINVLDLDRGSSPPFAAGTVT
jgi:hypothetical protein